MPNQNPIQLFEQWYADACTIEGVEHVDAFNLATVSADGQPSNRTLLLKKYDENGFVFYTNLNSRKGKEISVNNKASMCFYWDKLGFQVRIEGVCVQVDDAQADDYFKSRPMQSQVGAWASKQSTPLKSHGHLLKRLAKHGLKVPLGKMQRPEFWSGFRLEPHRMEFMQMKDYRLHERREFLLTGGAWSEGLLYP